MRPDARRHFVRAIVLAALVLIAFQACASGSPGGCPDAPSRASSPKDDAQHSADSAVDTTGWATAEQSAFASGRRFPERRRQQCLSDLGCAAPANLPTCPRPIEALPIDALMHDPARHVGRTVLARGRLIGAASLTQARCGSGCCNEGTGDILLTRTERAGGRSTASLAVVPLIDRTHPDAFHCARDDSMTCCGFETPEHDVVVSARLVRDQGRFALEEPALCVLRPDGERAPEVSFDADGCVAAAAAHPWGEHFMAGSRRCACYGGQVYCRADRSCFRGGQWFAPDEERPVSDHCGGVCICTLGPGWECQVRPCNTTYVAFAPGTATLDEANAKRLGDVSFSTIRGPIRVELRGHADPSEGKNAVALARRRAEYVARIAEKSGIPRERIEVRALGTFEPDRLARSASGSRAGVVMLFWQPELPRLPSPKPPD